MRLRDFFVGLLILSWLPVAAAAPLDWQACHLPGQREALRCGRLAVPRDYAQAQAGTVEIHVAMAPAIRPRAEPDPLFVLAGGPGQAGSDLAALLDGAFAKVRASRDIVFIDQRGTGRSGRLACAPADDMLARSDSALEADMLACLRGYGAGLLAYTTAAAAEDIEHLRQAVGAERINLWGGSYGTRLAQVYATRYPQQVRSLILDGVADADLIIGADALEFEAALAALLQRCADDTDCSRAFPTLAQQLQTVLQKLDTSATTASLPHPRDGAPLAAPISRQRLLMTVKYLLYSPQSAAQLPYLIARAAADDWRPLLAAQANSLDLAAAAPAEGLLLGITCREDWPRLDAAQRAQLAAAPIFGGSIAALDALCGELALPATGAASAPASASAQSISAPSLLLSGALDPVTPPARAERALRQLPHGQHLIAAGAGHIVSGLGCAPRLLRRFLDAPAAPLDGACLADIALPAFQTSAAGTAP
ncbi:alpha/beta fold hydrolase [Tahibacter harae]|uniref:Alpha/beta hydrolase n=1 Tax=Tahibacter harae TaxID=2963937 RepID=A0ABT1QTR8_9GAMM|nr:alpha/beta fold hydrolase [Tahibacter harae]MCQ4165700.1 alpha/beta hydrolase [Tahibacter harae]